MDGKWIMRSIVVLSLLTATVAISPAQTAAVPYIITAVAGSGPGSIGDGGPARQAFLAQPSGDAVDAAGNLYIAETAGNRVRKVAVDGTISTLAGTGINGTTGDGGPAVKAQLDYPHAVAVDPAGTVYIATESRIRKVAPGGVITTVTSDVNFPNGLAVDQSGNLYVADSGNNRILKITPDAKITTVAGGIHPSTFTVVDGVPATSAPLGYPMSVALDNSGDLYIGDFWLVRKVNAAGIISTVAGSNGYYGFGGDGKPATAALLNFVISGLAVDNAGNLWIADTNNQRVREVVNGIINTGAGTGVGGHAGDGGPATAAQLAYPSGIAFDRAGNLYIADQDNGEIRTITPSGTINTVAGGVQLAEGGPALAPGSLELAGSFLEYPALLSDSRGNIYISETGEQRVRKVTSAGTITTVAGTGVHGYGGDGGPATSAQLNSPGGLALDAKGNLYIADTFNNCIRLVAPDGMIATVAGNGKQTAGGVTFSGDGGPATSAQLNQPYAVATDAQGNLYIADSLNYRIRKVTPDGTIATIEGDGTVGAAPSALAVDSAGNVLFSEQFRIRKLSPSGTISVVAGGGTSHADGGPATSAQLGFVTALALDAGGNLYFTDTGYIPGFSPPATIDISLGQRIRRVSPAGIISTIAGTGVAGFNGNGGLALTALLNDPVGITVDSSGNVYIAEASNNLVRKLTPDPKVAFRAFSGDLQSGVVGATLAGPLVVQLLSGTGTGLPNTPVAFAVVSGSATLSAPTATTGSDGKASVALTLGSTPGPIAISATVPTLPALNFTAIATPDLSATAPAISAGGVLGAGLSVPAVTQISPNGIITIYGQRFAPAGSALRAVGPSDLVNGNLPTNLAGTCVQIGSQPAPMLLTSPNQLNVQVPSLTSTGPVPVQVIVNCGQTGEVKSAAVDVTLQPAAPEFFFFVQNLNGQNPVAAINAITGAYIGLPQLIPGVAFTPAKPGDILTLFLTGLGLTSPPVNAGQLATGIANMVAPVKVQLGAAVLQDADVLYAGVTPGDAGLYQVNIRVPAGTPDGDLPIQVTVGTYSTPPGAYLSVRQ